LRQRSTNRKRCRRDSRDVTLDRAGSWTWGIWPGSNGESSMHGMACTARLFVGFCWQSGCPGLAWSGSPSTLLSVGGGRAPTLPWQITGASNPSMFLATLQTGLTGRCNSWWLDWGSEKCTWLMEAYANLPNAQTTPDLEGRLIKTAPTSFRRSTILEQQATGAAG
jgi:hypothetical protein